MVVPLVAGEAFEVLQMLIFQASQLQDFFDANNRSQTQDTLHAHEHRFCHVARRLRRDGFIVAAG